MWAGKLVKLFCFCMALLIIRIVRTDQWSYFFLTWNLFLACIPWLLIRQYRSSQPRVIQVSIISCTILFLPNAPYILTDLFHLRERIAAPMWLDLVIILSFAFLGMVFFILSANRLLAMFTEIFRSRWITSALKFLVMLSSAYGIYLGRYLRFNSWDIIASPFDLARRMLISVFDPCHFKETFAVTLTFTVFLYLIFEIVASLKSTANIKTDELS